MEETVKPESPNLYKRFTDKLPKMPSIPTDFYTKTKEWYEVKQKWWKE